ncbi:hypothetical protein LguiB_002342 [Lonicera macranthoides]
MGQGQYFLLKLDRSKLDSIDPYILGLRAKAPSQAQSPHLFFVIRGHRLYNCAIPRDVPAKLGWKMGRGEGRIEQRTYLNLTEERGKRARPTVVSRGRPGGNLKERRLKRDEGDGGTWKRED